MDTKNYTLSTGKVLSSTELFEAMRIAETVYCREDVERTILNFKTFYSLSEEKKEKTITEATEFYLDSKYDCDYCIYASDYSISETLKDFEDNEE